MAHFAELDDNNIVKRVVVVDNKMLLKDGKEDEATGIAFLHSLFGSDKKWVQTSYNGNFWKNFAGMNFIYREDLDGFLEDGPPFPSWTLNEATCRWDPPTPCPENKMRWDEETKSWIKGTQSDRTPPDE